MVGLSLFGCEVNILTNLHIVHCTSQALLWFRVQTISAVFCVMYTFVAALGCGHNLSLLGTRNADTRGRKIIYAKGICVDFLR